MKTMAAVVLRKLIGLAYHRDFAIAQAVGIASYGGTEVSQVVLTQIILHFVETEHHILQFAIAVRYEEGDDTATIIGDTGRHAIFVGKGEYFHIVFIAY
jgi:hypothetical protein